MKTYSSTWREENASRKPCPSCSGTAFAPALDCGSFSFVECLGCGLAQQNPRADQETVAERYEGDYLEYEIRNEASYLDLALAALRDVGFDLEAEAAARARMADSGAARGASSPDAGGSPRAPLFVDVGCATGALLERARAAGFAARGVELCGPSAEYGKRKRGLDIFQGIFEDAGFAPGSVSVVHASHVIEHMADPAAFLSAAREALARGRNLDRENGHGTLILTTPNIEGLQAKCFGAAWRSAIWDHLFLFGKGTLSKMLGDAGFKIVSLKTWGGWAKGARPAFLKPALDRLAKPFGFGDVMVARAIPR